MKIRHIELVFDQKEMLEDRHHVQTSIGKVVEALKPFTTNANRMDTSLRDNFNFTRSIIIEFVEDPSLKADDNEVDAPSDRSSGESQ